MQPLTREELSIIYDLIQEEVYTMALWVEPGTIEATELGELKDLREKVWGLIQDEIKKLIKTAE